jgi:hypothetical protein
MMNEPDVGIGGRDHAYARDTDLVLRGSLTSLPLV